MGNFQRLVAALLCVGREASAGKDGDAHQSDWRFTYRSLNKRAVSGFDLPSQQPPLWNHTAASIISTAKSLTRDSGAVLDKLVTTNTPTFANVLLPLARQDTEFALSAYGLQFYQYVSANASLKDASVEATNILDNYDIAASMREDVFKLVDAVFQNQTLAAGLDAESQRLLSRTRRDYISNGLGLPAGPKRDRWREIQERLADLELQFNNIYNSQNESVWLTPEDLAGVPDDIVNTFEKGSGENQGKRRLAFKSPDTGLFSQYATNGDARRKVYLASGNKVRSVPSN